MNIYAGEFGDEYGAVERWENEGGRISHTQHGQRVGPNVNKQVEREDSGAPIGRFILKDVAAVYTQVA